MLSTNDLFAQALKIENLWFIEPMEFESDNGILYIRIDLVWGSSFYFEDAGRYPRSIQGM
jgi:hypothetical protein